MASPLGDASLYARTLSPKMVAGARYCAVATACTAATPTMPARCKNATSAPFGYDASAPAVVAAPLWPADGEGGLRWGTGLPLRVSVSCADVESGVSTLYLSLGTSRGASDLLDALEIVNASNATANASILAFNGVANRTTVRGVVRVGAAALPPAAGFPASADGTQIFASAVCTNRAGLAAEAAPSPAVVVDTTAPRDGTLRFPSLHWSEGDGRWHGAVAATMENHPMGVGIPGGEIPLEIDGFGDTGTGVAAFDVCVKMSASGFCDPSISGPRLVDGVRKTVLVVPLEYTNFAKAYFVTVTATDGMGHTRVASAQLFLDWTAPFIGAAYVRDAVGGSTVRATGEIPLALAGGASDVDIDDVEVHWTAVADTYSNFVEIGSINYISGATDEFTADTAEACKELCLETSGCIVGYWIDDATSGDYGKCRLGSTTRGNLGAATGGTGCPRTGTLDVTGFTCLGFERVTTLVGTPTCEFSGGANGSYAAQCDVHSDMAAAFCLKAHATNPAGLESAPTYTCMTVDPSPPTWPDEPPTLVRQAGGSLAVAWPAPVEPHFGPVLDQVAVLLR